MAARHSLYKAVSPQWRRLTSIASTPTSIRPPFATLGSLTLHQHHQALNRSLSTNADGVLLRRRRRRTSNLSNDNDDTTNRDATATQPSSNGSAFAPKDADGNLLDSQQYLSLASLSPWVPCPDMVIKRVFEIADATPDDVHVDLGCGDGRLNFAAVGSPWNVSSSWGVDVDENVLERCRERLGRRFVPSFFDGRGADATVKSEAERLEFLQADLIKVIERQKQKHMQQHNTEESPSMEDSITQKLSNSTIVTMYFVHDALQQLQPYLASLLGGKENVRVVTVGYEMKGWNPTWAERVLGLTVFKYDMKNVSNDPLDWRVDGENGNETSKFEEQGIVPTPEDFTLSLDIHDLDDESSPLAEYLRQKREQDMEELNQGLHIHHDEQLDDFASFRAKRKAREDASSDEYMVEDWELEEGGWDFDEDEDPEQLMMEAQKAMTEARMIGRKGMMAGLNMEGKKKSKASCNSKSAKPVWKKP
jgi:hypothetical protein